MVRTRRVFVGRDTRGSGLELEEALARGIASAGGNAVLAGVLPTPAVALLALDLGAVITASHNPPEYNGVKFFDRDGQKLTDAREEEIEALLDAAPAGGRRDRPRRRRAPTATSSTSSSASAPTSTGLRIGVDCANGAYTAIAPRAFEQLGAEVTAVGVEPDGTNINVGCGATDLRALQRTVDEHGGSTSASRSTATATGCSRSTANGEAVDGDQILAVLALDLGVELVAVTVMSNLGFHRLMENEMPFFFFFWFCRLLGSVKVLLAPTSPQSLPVLRSQPCSRWHPPPQTPGASGGSSGDHQRERAGAAEVAHCEGDGSSCGARDRLRPITYGMPKPMVPVLNRPVMEHILGCSAAMAS